uniref:Uncharacterized protein n=1 Tax=Anguilla anguilla TaxID=7936 RepID=A0A0E9QN87_ANGAN
MSNGYEDHIGRRAKRRQNQPDRELPATEHDSGRSCAVCSAASARWSPPSSSAIKWQVKILTAARVSLRTLFFPSPCFYKTHLQCFPTA